MESRVSVESAEYKGADGVRCNEGALTQSVVGPSDLRCRRRRC